MKLIKPAFVAAVALAWLSVAHAAAPITQAQVKTMLTQLDKAIGSRNVDEVTQWMADDIRIDLTIIQGDKEQKLNITKDEYAKSLYDTWGSATNYNYKRNKQTITLQGQSALVTADVSETIQFGPQTIKTSSQEVFTVTLQKGQPRITEMKATTKMLP